MQKTESFSTLKNGMFYTLVFFLVILFVLYNSRDKVNIRGQKLKNISTKVSLWVLRASSHSNQFHHRQTTGKQKIRHHNISVNSSYIILEENNVKRSDITKKIDYLPDQNAQPMKTIAVFDPLNQHVNFFKDDSFKKCEYKNCRGIKNYEVADVVFFIMPKLKMEPKFKRKKNQIWIFYTIEAPSRAGWFGLLNNSSYKNGMNLTISYTLKSDIPILYAKLVPVKNSSKKDYNSIFSNKTKMAAWFVSHCKTRSKRAQFVEKMKTRIDVDIFGMCGTKFCRNPVRTSWGKHDRESVDESTCFPMLSSDYKFYLAFENTMCKEYITEKFFKLFGNVDVVPVVRGGADYQKNFPSDIFVDASEFSTPENLADFLSDLAVDQERYIRYLKNKDKYNLASNPNGMMCKLCEKLHTMDHVTYENIRDWWTRDSCFDPHDSMKFW